MFVTKKKRFIAAFFLFVFSIELLSPIAVNALTSGPSQPEVTKFEPAGANDLVDLFSGDLKYNIPLLDVGGYPINLSYQSGGGMEDEASWVGAGWALNPGAINRTMRGLPDDFNGDGAAGDKINKIYSKKEFKKVGGHIVVKPSLFAWEFGSASLKVNVYKDNYYGIGASVGASLNFSLTQESKTPYTAGLNVDVNSDVRDGVGISPSLSLSKMYDAYGDGPAKMGLTGSLHYNTRSGLKNVSLSASYNTSKFIKDAPPNLEFSGTHYFGQTYSPIINVNTSNAQYAFNFDIGASVFGGYVGLGGGGYMYKEKILEKNVSVPAYGYLNYLKGRKNENALLDFNREKDGVFITSAPAIATPVATQDFFTASGQTGSQQFRPYFAGNYIVYDRRHSNPSTQVSAGVTLGAGWIYKGGARIEGTTGSAATGKWVAGNSYISPQEAAYNSITALDEPVYFKQVGEPTEADNLFLEKAGNQTEQVAIGAGITSTNYKSRSGSRAAQALKRDVRDRRNYVLSYLTAQQAQKYGLDKKINEENRVSGARKAHHISEMTVTDNEGKRMVYGIPVYNLKQEEATFSVDAPTNPEEARKTGKIPYGSKNLNVSTNPLVGNSSGRDNMISVETTPAYATSFLLTGILSPDYVDVSNDGITDDDLGTAVEFNYVKTNNNYKWRSPYENSPGSNGMANYNEGFLTDKKDDKGNYVYGEKELWYLQQVESKTMVAIFHLSDREDGLGVLDNKGGKDVNCRMKKLDRIELFSKADYFKNANNALPIKTVHFEYDYSLYPNVPNNSGNPVLVGTEDSNQKKGKLTLKKVYFTFGKNSRGQSNPYLFGYEERLLSEVSEGKPTSEDPEHLDQYQSRQADRWGSYKKSFFNKIVNGNRVLNNSEFPYTIQEDASTDHNERAINDLLVSKWQLVNITTPTGSLITAEYESDDYAFVQNRRAMQMCFIKGITSEGTATGLAGADKLVVHLPKPVATTDEFKNLYLKQPDGSFLDKLFFKVFANIDNRPKNYEYVYGYAALDLSNSTASGNTAFVALKRLNDYNPIAKTAWQMLRTELPQLAYDNYDNSEVADDGQAAIRSIVSSIGNLREITQPFDKRAVNRKFSDRIDLNKSLVRLNNPDMKKIGGGARVKLVKITDNWKSMNGSQFSSATYGQLYDYALRDKNGGFISSSGVASYEPQVGNEENPFHEPETFTEKVHWGSDKYHFVEKPYCENYFPAAAVGYSKVTVTSVGSDYFKDPPQLIKHTGVIENEFYTAKDFPTLVDNLPLEKKPYENSLLLKLFTANSVKRMTTSQGFKVELNDMHGKPKSVTVFNKGRDVVSSTEYFYNVKDDNAEIKELKNEVPVLRQNGSIVTTPIATDIDMITDIRESKNESYGASIGGYTGGMALLWFYIPYLAVNFSPSTTRDTYNSICAVKVIHKYGMLRKTRTIQNGSTIEAENLLWDSQTGQVLLTRTQNAFDQSHFAFNYPAYMAYEGMSAAYKNVGATFSSFTIGANGSLAAYSSSLFPGDELVLTNNDNVEQRLWVIKSNDGVLRAVDALGEFVSGTGSFTVLRSGRRNLLTAGAGTVLLSKDPRNGNAIDLSESKRILDAKAVVYKEQWPVGIENKNETIMQRDDTCGTVSRNCMEYFYKGAIRKIITGTRRGIYARSSDNLTVANILLFNLEMRAPMALHPCDVNFLNGQPSSSVNYSVKNPRSSTTGTPPVTQYFFNNGDTAMLGDYAMIYSYINPAFTTLTNSSMSEAAMNTELNTVRCTWYGPTGYQALTKYVIVKQDCNFSFRRIDNCTGSIPDGTTFEQAVSGYANSTLLATFSVVSPYFPTQVCSDPVDKVINPYFKGILGNWRPHASYVYTVNRSQPPGDPAQPGGTDIRVAGYYNSYNPFWSFQTSGLVNYLTPGVDIPSHDNRWVWNTKSIHFDQKGNEIENVDALNRYGSALFGYQKSLAVAVAANARQNEIAFDGFEDYDFELGNVAAPCPAEKHLDFQFNKSGSSWTNSGGQIISTKSHTGRYSYQINSTVTINKSAGNSTHSDNVLGFTNNKYKLLSNELAKGFAPISGKNYLLSFWVNDHVATINKIQNLQVQVNGSSYPVSATVVPVVEGWKRLDIQFTAGSSFELKLIPSSTLEIDDLRIMPFDGQLSSYVYHDKTLRLMAQLDENNFATLYEYDDEGTPIRVKKETERGIMTLKENRQSFKSKDVAQP